MVSTRPNQVNPLAQDLRDAAAALSALIDGDRPAMSQIDDARSAIESFAEVADAAGPHDLEQCLTLGRDLMDIAGGFPPEACERAIKLCLRAMTSTADISFDVAATPHITLGSRRTRWLGHLNRRFAGAWVPGGHTLDLLDEGDFDEAMDYIAEAELEQAAALARLADDIAATPAQDQAPAEAE